MNHRGLESVREVSTADGADLERTIHNSDFLDTYSEVLIRYLNDFNCLDNL